MRMRTPTRHHAHSTAPPAASAHPQICVICTRSYKRGVEFVKYHTAKVTSLAWTPDSLHIATGSLDSNIMVRARFRGASLGGGGVA